MKVKKLVHIFIFLLVALPGLFAQKDTLQKRDTLPVYPRRDTLTAQVKPDTAAAILNEDTVLRITNLNPQQLPRSPIPSPVFPSLIKYQ